MLREILKYLKGFGWRHRPLVEVLIYRDNLLHNLRIFRESSPKLQIAPVLKSNAYGHGLKEVASILDGEGIPFFVVDSYFEALILRREGIKSEILVIGFTHPENICQNRLKNITFAVVGMEQLREIAKNLERPTNFHLKIDTGMHRQGISPGEINEAITLINKNANINLSGICSHLADADNSNEAQTAGQIERWNKIVDVFKANFAGIKYFHLSASAGARFADKINANVMRLGLGLYGIDSNGKSDLKPALEMKSVISRIKDVSAGSGVGYNFTFRAFRRMKVAAVPVGYFEGVDRRLSNKGFFKIGSVFCPIVGRVSMNISIIDAGAIPNIKMARFRMKF
jgi:alanine racemase